MSSSQPLANLTAPGSFLLGALFSVGLFGVIAVQIYSYNISYPKDRLSVKIYAHVLFALSLTKMIIEVHDSYIMLADNFGNMATFKQRHLYWVTVFLTCTIMYLVQLYYAFCVTVLSKNKLFGLLIVAIATTSYAGGLTTTAMAYIRTHPNRDYIKKVASIGLWHGGSAVCDLLISLSMTFYLTRMQSSFHRTKVLINKVVRWMMETGILLTVITFSCASLWFVNHSNNFCNIYIGYIGHLYIICVLVLLNNRLTTESPQATQQLSDLRFTGLENNAGTAFGLSTGYGLTSAAAKDLENSDVTRSTEKKFDSEEDD